MQVPNGLLRGGAQFLRRPLKQQGYAFGIFKLNQY